MPWSSRFSIVNSLMIVLFLTGMIAMIVLRALYRDIAKYNEENVEDATEESGWKVRASPDVPASIAQRLMT